MADYYIRTDGDNGLAGTTPATGWATGAKAVSVATAGDIVHILGTGSGFGTGLFSPAATIYFNNNNGTPTAPIIYMVDNQGNGGTAEFDFTGLNMGFKVTRSHHIFLGQNYDDRLIIKNGNTTGFFTQLASCTFLQNVDIYGFNIGVETDRSQSWMSLCSVYNCTTYGIRPDSVLRLFGSKVYACGIGLSINRGHALVYESLFYNNTVGGMHLYAPAAGSQTNVIACVFYNNTTYAYRLSSMESATILNNIFHTNGIGIDGGSDDYDSLTESNCYYNNTQDVVNAHKGDGAINADPLFNNPATGDFTLQASSPCISKGFPSDLLGTFMDSELDIGAFQCALTTWSPRGITAAKTRIMGA